MLQTTSGSSIDAKTAQTSKLLSTMDLECRQKILEKAKIPKAEISEDIMVAMKVDMSIPWEKMKTMSK